MYFLRVDLNDLVFNPTWPIFGHGIDLIEINILIKFHEECIKTAPSEVYTCFFFLRTDLMT